MKQSPIRQQSDKQSDKIKETQEKLGVAYNVEKTLKSKGWCEIVEPLIDKMIIDTIGGKVNGIWLSGRIANAEESKSSEFFLGYKQFGIDLINRLKNYTAAIGSLEKHVQDLTSRADELRTINEQGSFRESKYAPK